MVKIYGSEIEVKIGSVIKPDNWRFPEKLIASDWDAAQFRIPLNNDGPIKSLAVNVTITGRTWQWRQSNYWIRVRIEFVGDGEPSQFCSGWMLRQ